MIISICIPVAVIGTMALFLLAGDSPLPVSSPSPVTPPTEQVPTVHQDNSAPALEPGIPASSETPVEPQPLNFEQKLEIIRQAIIYAEDTGASKAVTFVLTEAELNDKARELLGSADIQNDIPIEVKNISIGFEADNTVSVIAETSLYSFNVAVKAIAAVTAEDGEPYVKVDRVECGIIRLPHSLIEKGLLYVSHKIDEFERQLVTSAVGGEREISLKYKDIAVREGEMTVSLEVVPIN